MRNIFYFYLLCFAVIPWNVCVSAEAAAEAPARPVTWREAVSPQDMNWYKTDEAARIAANVLLLQSEFGGWDGSNMVRVLSDADKMRLAENRTRRSTLDNGATIRQLQFLANIYSVTGHEKYKEAFLKGIEYLLTAQYPNGGWPQSYPLRGGSANHITFNDGVMIGAMRTLDEVRRGRAPFNIGDEQLRARAAEAVNRGVELILKCQIKINGVKTVWGQQHDEVTLEPRGARTYEPASLTASESTGVVRFLMDIENPSPEVISAVEHAIKWFDRVRITGVRVERVRDDAGRWNRIHVQDPNAPPMWGRLYEMGTDKPIYVDRDGIPKYSIDQIGHERRNGYAWTGRWPEHVLTRYDDWAARWTPGRNVLLK
ncbi:MAG TPA: pectate lyase [Sedimentisphaerales bacterium]|nr:pectate lyase [Sedimentisphaerales bacterium]